MNLINPVLLEIAQEHLNKQAFIEAGNSMLEMGLPPEQVEQMQQEEQAAMQEQQAQQQQQQMQQQAMQQFLQNSQQGAPGSGPSPQQGEQANNGVKMKIDTNELLIRVLKMVARIADALEINIPASEMVISPDELAQYAQPEAPKQPAQGGQTPGAIQPIQPVAGFGEKAGEDIFSPGVALRDTVSMRQAKEKYDSAMSTARKLLG